MKKSLILLVTLLIVMTTYAQDVVLDWAIQIGGTDTDFSYAIEVDATGNIYTTGYFSGTVDFDPSEGVFNLTAVGSGDIFISKLDATGNFVWAKQMGGTNFEFGLFIALDNVGNIYTTGYFTGTVDFDPGANTFNLTVSEEGEAFISKLDASGDFLWAKQFSGVGGVGGSLGTSLSLDNSGNVFATGYFDQTVDFDPSVSDFNLTSLGSLDIYILKLDSSGNFVWAKKIGGTSMDEGVDIKVDNSGSNIYITGAFRETVDFDPNAGVYNLSSSGSRDIYISKLDVSGNFVWAKKIGGSSSDRGHSIAIDNTNNYMYITGEFSGTTDFDPGSRINNLTAVGGQDSFVTKLDMLGNFVWARGMGGSYPEEPANSIQLDSAGDVIVTGWFSGTSDFDPGVNIYNLTSTGENDVFITKLDASGNFVWAKKIGGTSYDEGWSLSVDSSDNIYTTGTFSGTADFDPGAATFNLTSAGGDSDAFIHKMSPENLSISEINFGKNFKLYPNPSNGSTNIELGSIYQEVNISIFDLLGKEMINKTYKNIDKVLIDTQQFTTGVYVVKVESNINIASLKLVVK